MTLPTLAPLHLGDLHAYEAILLGVLAFGPFVVLAFVVVAIRRRDIAEEEAEDEEKGTAADRDADGNQG